jgi:hypothetical protein
MAKGVIIKWGGGGCRYVIIKEGSAVRSAKGGGGVKECTVLEKMEDMRCDLQKAV